jgi:hypothetical protein
LQPLCLGHEPKAIISFLSNFLSYFVWAYVSSYLHENRCHENWEFQVVCCVKTCWVPHCVQLFELLCMQIHFVFTYVRNNFMKVGDKFVTIGMVTNTLLMGSIRVKSKHVNPLWLVAWIWLDRKLLNQNSLLSRTFSSSLFSTLNKVPFLISR